jgi:glutamate/tyrosine decarboxylase-like PLP-dependent enzyme
MNITQLPQTSFIDPKGKNREETTRLAQAVFDLVLSHIQSAYERPPLPDITSEFSFGELPFDPVPENEWLNNLRQLLEGSMNARTPRFIAHMNSIPTTASILADFAASAVDNNMLSLEMSPSFSRLEHRLLKKMAKLFGLGTAGGGVLVGGGSLANLQALAVARNAIFKTVEHGLTPSSNQPVIFASGVSHTSIQKAAMLLGFGTTAVRHVTVNENSQMNIGDLKKQIELSRNEGKTPFCIVATAGTTVTGNIDPLVEIYRIAKENELWFHVDAAYGGALIFSDNHKQRLKGIELADSITFNPHKWLYVARTCSMVLFRDLRILETAFRIPAPYTSMKSDFTNIGEISVHGTNHADVLKLWFSLQHIGIRGCAHLIDECYRMTHIFLQHIKRRPYLELASEPEMNLICFRVITKTISLEKLDDLNSKIQRHLLSKHKIFLALIPYKGARWLRADILNPYIDESLIDLIFMGIDEYHQYNVLD